MNLQFREDFAKIKSVVSTTATEGMKLLRRHIKSTRGFLADQAMDDQFMSLLPLHIGEVAPQVRESRPKEFITVGLIVVIVKIVFF
jgi:hypothetical protein